MNKIKIKGVKVKVLEPFVDKRGFLVEVFRKDFLKKEILPVMAYVSLTYPKISRGPHMHLKQTDYFCFLGTSRFKLYLWDNRPDSPTFKRYEEIDIKEKEITIAIIPPKVVHGYKNIGRKEGFIINFPNKLYRGWKKKTRVDEVRFEDMPDAEFKIK